MIKKINIILILIFFIILKVNSFDNSSDTTTDNTTIDNTNDNSKWIYDYISISKDENIYDNIKIIWHKVDIDYLKSLKFRNRFLTGIKDLDDKNIIKNTNILPFYPFIFMPVFNYFLNTGFDVGFIFSIENIKSNSLTFASYFSQNVNVIFFIGIDSYGVLKDKRLNLSNNFYLYTSIPQYYSKINYNKDINFFYNTFNKIWQFLRISFNDLNSTGIYYTFNVDYRIPILEINSITRISFFYRYDYVRFINNREIFIDKHNFYIKVSEDFIFNKTRQSNTVLEGNYIKGSFDFFIPTMIGDIASDFKFKFRLEDRFYYKFYKEFYIKIRGIIVANYNISEDFSGDKYIRGYANEELTGFFSILLNSEIYIPLIHISIKDSVNQENFEKKVNFILYLTFFIDSGFTIENFSYILEDRWYRTDINYIKNSLTGNDLLDLQHLGNNNYIFPALSVGSGLKFYPYFLHFIFRFDFSMNLLKAIIYQKPEESFQIVFSLSDSF